MREERIIIHCDLDAFFASVEILHHGFPEDEPLIIGSDPMQGADCGIVSTCNYVAREYGVRSAMPDFKLGEGVQDIRSDQLDIFMEPVHCIRWLPRRVLGNCYELLQINSNKQA